MRLNWGSTLDLDEALLIEEICTGSDTCVRPLAYNESHYTHEGNLELCDTAFHEDSSYVRR